MSEDHGFGGGGEDYRGTSRRKTPSRTPRPRGSGEDLGSGRGEDLSASSRSQTRASKRTKSSDLYRLRAEVRIPEQRSRIVERSGLLGRKNTSQPRLMTLGLN